MKILVVDDDVISRKKIGFLIKSLGHETIMAGDGEEAYRMWLEEKPRIIITDWMMPKCNGLELCQKIRSAGATEYTYLIIVTSKNDAEDIVKGISAGADDFISKPFIKEELAARIDAGRRIIEIESRDVIIMAISKLAEFRDSDTGYHIERIRHYCKTLANYLFVNEQFQGVIDPIFIDNIFMTSMLHDIGKMGIPDAILLKPDKLTTGEFEIMKKHTTIGYETLKEAAVVGLQAKYLVMGAEIAHSHHERYDGSGYPLGLKADGIPVSARIVAIADVYDALVNERVYKKAFSHEVAKKIILDGKGSHFDPVIVDGFIACEEAFINICSRLKDKE